MEKQITSTERAPAAIGPYSQAVAWNNLLFISGQIPLDPATGEIVNETFEAEARRVLENLMGILTANGLSATAVLKTTIFLTDLANFQETNAIYAEYFGEFPPARSTIQVAALPRGARIEIEAIAALP